MGNLQGTTSGLGIIQTFLSPAHRFWSQFFVKVSFNIFLLLVKMRFRFLIFKQKQLTIKKQRRKKNMIHSFRCIEENRGKSPTGDRLSKTGHQHGRFSRIGNQSVAILSPEHPIQEEQQWS